ncbi:TRAP transporter small permease subunit [Ferrovibrio sp.]|uniref:TRAP transporter small permease n=1 Tax=Ferrovibrio sp. TaxID=1917215 RepID=UPI00311D9CB3
MAEALPSAVPSHRRRIADRIAAWLAVLGAAILLAAALASFLSVGLRITVNGQVRGDFEILSVGSGLAILLFFPWCQSSRAHVVIGIFTDWLPARILRPVDAFWSLVLAAGAALLCWRLWIGFIETLRNNDITAMLHIPLFIVSLAALAGVAGTALLAAMDVAALLRPVPPESSRNEA